MGISTEVFPATIQARCLVEPGEGQPPYGVLALHGYGQTPEIMLALTRKMLGARPLIGALAGPFQHYSALGPQASTVYNWGSREHWADAIRLHHHLVSEALDRVGAMAGVAASRLMLVGFSQPVGLNYRFALAHPDRVGAVAGLCGGVPGDWERQPGGRVDAALFHVARADDEFYPAAQVERFAERLRTRAADVEYHLLPGPHRFPSQASPLVNAWLARLGWLD